MENERIKGSHLRRERIKREGVILSEAKDPSVNEIGIEDGCCDQVAA